MQSFYLFSLFLQNNNIKTSKYTLLTFLPLNLFEQFQRLANFYFACLLILQLIDVISSLTPVTTAVPLVGVLTLIAIKDGYDDIVSIFQFWSILANFGSKNTCDNSSTSCGRFDPNCHQRWIRWHSKYFSILVYFGQFWVKKYLWQQQYLFWAFWP